MSNHPFQKSSLPHLDGPTSPAQRASTEFEARSDARVAGGRLRDLAVQRSLRVVLLAAVVIGIRAGLAFGIMAGAR